MILNGYGNNSLKDQIISNWDELGDWVDKQQMLISPSYLSEAKDPKYPRDAFSLGQLASKAWLLNELYPVAPYPIKDWVILGSWIGAIVPFLHSKFIINRIYGLDFDHTSVQLSEVFNRKYFEDDWKFKGVVSDVSTLDTSKMQFFTAGELIETKPGVVINTSCEHMSTEWFDTADTDQLIVMQTNDSEFEEGHINVCRSVEDMQQKYPLSKTLYAGQFKMPSYTRLMQIGYK